MSTRLHRTFFAAAALAFAATTAQAGTPCHGSACYKLVHTPPAFKTVSEEVMVRPARHVARHIPAEYGAVTETVMVRPARTMFVTPPPKLAW